MTPRTKTKAKDTEQSKRFIEKAREIKADESGEAFERAFEKIVPEKKPEAIATPSNARPKSQKMTERDR